MLLWVGRCGVARLDELGDPGEGLLLVDVQQKMARVIVDECNAHLFALRASYNDTPFSSWQ